MSSRVELANPNLYATPQEYIETHLVPVVAELKRVTEELLAPGSTSSEAWEADMVPECSDETWSRLDQPLVVTGKHAVFDGSEYESIPKELLRQKQLKVQLSAVVYAKHNYSAQDTVEFRLVRDDGMVIRESHIATHDSKPIGVTRVLPFGDVHGCISPQKRTYYIEGCSPSRTSLPVCRRFALSFVYI